MITVNLKVDYGIKGDIINDMLTSLPYSGLKQDGSLTIVHFDRENFNFDSEFQKNVSIGNYRSVPLIRFYDKDGVVMAIILDTPESRWYSFTSNKIHFIPIHQFSPLVDYEFITTWINVTEYTKGIDLRHHKDSESSLTIVSEISDNYTGGRFLINKESYIKLDKGDVLTFDGSKVFHGVEKVQGKSVERKLLQYSIYGNLK